MRISAALWASAALLAGQALAGLNAAATLHVDANPGTDAVETSAVTAGRTFKITVRIAGAVNLDGFAFELGYDTARTVFLGARSSSSGDGIANFLESRGGQAVAFVGRLSARDTSRVTVADALAGSDSARSPSGDGVLAILEFRAKLPGLVQFHPGKAELLDWNQEPDTAIAFLGASVDVQDPVGLRNPRVPGTMAVLRLRGEGDFPWRDILGRQGAASRPAMPALRISASRSSPAR